ncbi:MAG: hypothetical protein H3C31_05105 [Brumimicrobium sp.]|nr:hypothetical protein [Brumimicrobium sp.]MCO5269817.1 hypothetical protein [Brumimicrobium sp.]
METNKTDFTRFQELKKNKKTFYRLLIYAVTTAILIYLILSSIKQNHDAPSVEIKQFEVESE